LRCLGNMRCYFLEPVINFIPLFAFV
jgi:hypothetical protein